MRVAVTGGTGLVGTLLLPALVERGHEVRALVRPLPGRVFPELDGVQWVPGRMDELEPIEELVEGADAILHAAFLHPEKPPMKGRSESEHYVRTNYLGSMRLLERTPGLSAQQLIYVSSLAVYGGEPDHDPRGERFPRDEDYPLWPPEFYGAQRAGVEKMVVAAAQSYGLNASVFRLGHVLGERPAWKGTSLGPTVDEAIEHGEIRTQHGGYVVAVEDTVEILCDAVGDETLGGQVFNTFDRWYDFTEAAPLLSRLLERPIGVACPAAVEPRSPILGDRIHARYDRWRTEAKIEELLGDLVRRRIREGPGQ